MIRVRGVTEAGIASGAIRWFTQSAISHMGVLLPDGRELGSRAGKDGAAAAGVQYRPGNYAAFTNVVILEFDATPLEQTAFWNFLNTQVGKPYDDQSILGMALGRNWRSPEAWFCSELVVAALEAAGVFPPLTTDVDRIPPGMALMLCEAVGFKAAA